MKLRLGINGKMLLFILGAATILYAVILGYAGFKLKDISSQKAQVLFSAESQKMVDKTNVLINQYTEAILATSKVMSSYKQIPIEKRRVYYGKVLESLLQGSNDVDFVWTKWKANSIDNSDSKHISTENLSSLGNFNQIYQKRLGEIVLEKNIDQGISKILDEDIYPLLESSKNALVFEPAKVNNKQVLQSYFAVPIISDNEFVGIVGLEMPLNKLQQIFKNENPLEKGQVFILSNTGRFIVHPDSSMIGKTFYDYAKGIDTLNNVSKRIANGESFEIEYKDPYLNQASVASFNRVDVGATLSPWSVVVNVPKVTLYNQSFRVFRIIMLVGILVLMLAIIFISRTITKPLSSINKSLRNLSKGDISKGNNVNQLINDEITDLSDSTRNLFEGVKEVSNFARKIGEGDLEANYNLVSENDELGKSLNRMQKSLILAQQQDYEKKTNDEKRNWITRGLAKFGDIIRKDNDNMERFSLNILKNLNEYIGASQSAIYINQSNEYDQLDEDVFELKAAIAYGKSIMLKKKVDKGKELIGRSADENKLIHLVDIPETYVNISPGMKDKKRPRNLIIAPMSINDVTYGVFEIISYKKFELHHIEFIERLSENIASIISNVKTNVRTAKLLEQSQYQADELTQHEEEMRQNLEEMQSTQEEVANRENNLKSYIDSLKKSIMMAELDSLGKIIDVSPSLALLYGVSVENMIGKFYSTFVAQDEYSLNEFSIFWENMLRKGKSIRDDIHANSDKSIELVETFKLIENDNLPSKVILVAYNKSKYVEEN